MKRQGGNDKEPTKPHGNNRWTQIILGSPLSLWPYRSLAAYASHSLTSLSSLLSWAGGGRSPGRWPSRETRVESDVGRREEHVRRPTLWPWGVDGRLATPHPSPHFFPLTHLVHSVHSPHSPGSAPRSPTGPCGGEWSGKEWTVIAAVRFPCHSPAASLRSCLLPSPSSRSTFGPLTRPSLGGPSGERMMMWGKHERSEMWRERREITEIQPITFHTLSRLT